MTIETSRLRLRTWRDGDRDAFAALHADLQVMVDAVAPLDRAASDAKLARYAATCDDVGYSRWCRKPRGRVPRLRRHDAIWHGITWVATSPAVTTPLA